MSSVVIAGDTSGTVTLSAPAVSGTTTLTLPTTSGTVLTTANTFGAGTGPAFRAYRSSSNQAISAATATKVAFNAETFDTNSNYDSTTNYRFTPTVAGYYQINSTVSFSTGAGSINIFKNGSNYVNGTEVTYNASLGGHMPVSDIVYCDGLTDYIEIYVYLTTGTTISYGTSNTVFSASMVRSA